MGAVYTDVAMLDTLLRRSAPVLDGGGRAVQQAQHRSVLGQHPPKRLQQHPRNTKEAGQLASGLHSAPGRSNSRDLAVVAVPRAGWLAGWGAGGATEVGTPGGLTALAGNVEEEGGFLCVGNIAGTDSCFRHTDPRFFGCSIRRHGCGN
mmetsp:Transcript_23021/g.63948  ORF Transcript_23021/g.63948 Transcript_23021/m.63948 type:complete len:149 (+) Transcript_23021:2378-2824(+)